MRLEYDREADAAYLYVGPEGRKVATTVMGEDEAEGINLDLDRDGKLVGVEVLGASARLSAELLK